MRVHDKMLNVIKVTKILLDNDHMVPETYKTLTTYTGLAKRCCLGCVISLPGSAWPLLSKQPRFLPVSVLFVLLSVSGRISASLDTPGISIIKNSQNPFSL